MKRQFVLFLLLISLVFSGGAQSSFNLNDFESIIESMSSGNSYTGGTSSSSDVKASLSSDSDLNLIFASMEADDGYGENFDFDAIYNEFDPSPSSLDFLMASVESNMSISGTLDFIDNAYSSPINPNSGIPVTSLGKFKGISGPATLPILGNITSRFGYRPKYGRMHKGVDIALSVGDTVRSALEGTVSRVDWDQNGYGLYVIVKHANNIETRYAHLKSALVVPGEVVLAGMPIALGGNTGNSTGPHLHFETRFQGQPLDPTMLFDFNTGTGNANAFMASNITEEQVLQAASLQGRSTYVVKLGDTLSGIARKARISVHTLCRLNNLNSNDIPQPGRMLKLR